MKRRVSIKTVLPHYYPNRELPLLSDDQLTELVRKRDLNGIIEAKLRHALSLGSLHAAKHRNRTEEIGSLSLFHLVKGVHIFIDNYYQPDVTAEHLNKYLTTHIYYAVRRSLIEDRLIRVPSTMVDLAVNETNSYCDPKALDILNILIKRLSPRCEIAYENTPDVDLRDVIEAVLTSDEERRILELRIIGCSDREVGETIQRSVSFVTTQRNRILHSIRMELMK